MSRWGSWVVPGTEGRHAITRITVKRRQDLQFYQKINAHPHKRGSPPRRGGEVGVGAGKQERVGVTVLNLTPTPTPKFTLTPTPTPRFTPTPTPSSAGVKRGRGADFFSCCRVQQVEQKQFKRQNQDFQKHLEYEQTDKQAEQKQQQKQIRENEGQRSIQPICEFLKGKTLFVTGATGFLAKVLVEKILYEQPDVKKIYLLIQRRNGMTAQDRLREQVFSSPAFNRLRGAYGAKFEEFMESKLEAVQGDLSAPKMGMDPETIESLQGQIEIAVNSAATTTFDERYDFAIKLNTLGAQEMARFAAGCTNLKLLVHVSTAFVNGMREGVGPETPFGMGHTIIQELNNKNTSPPSPTPTPSLDIHQEIQAAHSAYEKFKQEFTTKNGRSQEDIDAEIIEQLKVFGMERAQKFGWQDTYVFTKAMGEMLVGHESTINNIPTVILRPSIVESAYKEPIQGWMEGIRMADPIIIAYGKGQVSGFAGGKDSVLDIIPVDFVINSLLATMPKHACVPGLTVYHSASSENPNIISKFARLVTEHFQENPMVDKNGPIRVDEMKVYGSQEQFLFDVWKQYQLPFQMDQFKSQFFMWMQAGNGDPQQNLNRKRQLIAQKTQEQFSYLAKIYTPYTFYKCRFEVERMQQLYNELCEEDQEKFYFDIQQLDWAEYVKHVHVPGLRKFVLKGR